MNSSHLSFREFVNNYQSSFDDWEVYNLYMSNPDIPVKEIAQKTRKSIGEVYRVVGRMGGRPNRHSINHENVKMFHGGGMPVRHIAQLTGYTPRNVRYIISK